MWDPRLYLQFDEERFRPAFDLLGRVRSDPGRIVDLGSGTGDLTASLAARWPEASVVGIDNSPEMLEHARSAHPRIEFIDADIRTVSWEGSRRPDLVFSNAALQWLDEHEVLFPRLFDALAADGVLAVQMPNNHDEPAYGLAREAATRPRWAERAAAAIPEYSNVLAPTAYHELLSGPGRELDIWQTEYLHVLRGENPVASWLSGTFLVPALSALGPDGPDFQAEWAALVAEAYPMRSDGTTLFPFRRLFMVATRVGSTPGSSVGPTV